MAIWGLFSSQPEMGCTKNGRCLVLRHRAIVAMSAVSVIAAASGWSLVRFKQMAYGRGEVAEQVQAAASALTAELSASTIQRLGALVKNPAFAECFRYPSGPAEQQATRCLEGAAAAFQADLVYLMNRHGTVVACGCGVESRSLTGNNYAFRVYFKEALAGQMTSYPALGVTTGKLGVYFSAPVQGTEQEGILGVLTVKKAVEHFSDYVQTCRLPAALLTPEGVVLAANRPGLVGKALTNLPSEVRERMRRDRQFGPEGPSELGWTLADDVIVTPDARWLSAQRPIAGTPFRIRVWSTQRPDASLPAFAAVTCLLFTLLAGYAFATVWRRRSEHQRLCLLGSILEHSTNGFLVTDSEGRIKHANPAFVQMTGFGLEDILGQIPRFLQSGEHAPDFCQDLWNTIRSGREWRGEFRNRRKDGSLY